MCVCVCVWGGGGGGLILGLILGFLFLVYLVTFVSAQGLIGYCRPTLGGTAAHF